MNKTPSNSALFFLKCFLYVRALLIMALLSRSNCKHRVIIAIYLCMFAAAMVLPLLAIIDDELATVTGAFQKEATEFDLLNGWIDAIIPYVLTATLTTTEMIIDFVPDREDILIEFDTINAWVIPYQQACDEWEMDNACNLELGGLAFVVVSYVCMALIFLTGLCLFASRSSKCRYIVSLSSFAIGCILLGMFFAVHYQVKENDCVAVEVIEENLGDFFWILDALTDADRWCFSHDRSWMNVEVDESLLFVLISGGIMCFAGISFCFVMNCFVEKPAFSRKTGRRDSCRCCKSRRSRAFKKSVPMTTRMKYSTPQILRV